MKNFEDRAHDYAVDIWRRLNARYPYGNYPSDPLEIIERELKKFFREMLKEIDHYS